MKSASVLFITFAACLLLSACDGELRLTTGKQLYDHHCARCHGNSGKGKFLLGVPPNRETGLQEIQIIFRMRHPKGKMPAFDELSAEEASRIAHYLNSL